MKNHYVSVQKSPVNRSISKALYSFSKSRRFSDSLKKSTADNFYNISQGIGRGQKAGIGYGNKLSMSMSSSANVPSPQNYSIKSLFDGCKKGYIFGMGRQKFKNGGIFSNSLTPGPGAYTPNNANKKLKVSFKTKLNPIEMTNAKTPGPGSYNVPRTINQNGKCFLSNVRSTSVSSFGTPRSRSQSSKYNTPGPGYYESKQNMSPTGTYFNTRMKNSQAGYFDKSVRKQFGDSTTKQVGPGSYDHYTQFGAR